MVPVSNHEIISRLIGSQCAADWKHGSRPGRLGRGRPSPAAEPV